MTPTLTALMVLWVNMVSDAIPSFSLGYDVAETDLMKENHGTLMNLFLLTTRGLGF